MQRGVLGAALQFSQGRCAARRENRLSARGKHSDRVLRTKQGAVFGAALRFSQAGTAPRRENRLSARGGEAGGPLPPGCRCPNMRRGSRPACIFGRLPLLRLACFCRRQRLGCAAPSGPSAASVGPSGPDSAIGKSLLLYYLSKPARRPFIGVPPAAARHPPFGGNKPPKMLLFIRCYSILNRPILCGQYKKEACKG